MEIKIKNTIIGSNKIVLIAGPCAVESHDQYFNSIKDLKCVDIFRGGAFKPRTSPESFQGLKDEGINILKEASLKYSKPFVTEVTDIEYFNKYKDSIDIVQIGARAMQNFELLKEIGKTDKVVLVKRGFGNTIDELIEAIKYIELGGNKNIILCERGIRTFENSTRFTLDISAVKAIKERCDYPVIVDPSHAAGNKIYVESLSLASIAAGADGLMIEVHYDPSSALSDKAQALNVSEYNELTKKIEKVASAIGRSI